MQQIILKYLKIYKMKKRVIWVSVIFYTSISLVAIINNEILLWLLLIGRSIELLWFCITWHVTSAVNDWRELQSADFFVIFTWIHFISEKSLVISERHWKSLLLLTLKTVQNHSHLLLKLIILTGQLHYIQLNCF